MKINKFKFAGLIAMLTAGLMGHAAESNQSSDSIKAYQKTVRIPTNLTIEQMEQFIKKSNSTLAKLKKVIDSDKTNPEERFEAIQAYNSVVERRDAMQKQLDKAVKKQKSTIDFNAAREGR